MRILRTTFDRDSFFLDLARLPRAALVLDYNGTLAPFHRESARVALYPGLVPALNELMVNGETRVVVVDDGEPRGAIPSGSGRARYASQIGAAAGDTATPGALGL